MAKYRAVVGFDGRIAKGAVIDSDLIDPNRLDSYRRLGFIELVDDIDGMTKTQLVALAKARGIDVPPGAKKADVKALVTGG